VIYNVKLVIKQVVLLAMINITLMEMTVVSAMLVVSIVKIKVQNVHLVRTQISF